MKRQKTLLESFNEWWYGKAPKKRKYKKRKK